MPKLAHLCSLPSWLTLGLLITLAGCHKNIDTKVYQSGLVYCSEGSPVSFNPQLDTSGTTTDATSHQLYDRLLDFDPVSGKIIPALATHWEISEDGLTYTFHLHADVHFHSTSYFTPTRLFNADDVLFSINRWRLPEHPYHLVSGGNYPYFQSLGLNNAIATVDKVDDLTVKIALKRPDSSFLANLATDFAVILSKEYADTLLKQDQAFLIDELPIGTGPFQFVSYRKDAYIRYKRNDEYWKSMPIAENLVFDITPSGSLRLAKLMTGECDIIAFPSHSELGIIEQRDDLRLDEKPSLNVGFWAFNTQKPPFDNPQVRRALALAVDNQALIDAVYFDGAIPAKGIIPPSSWAYEEGSRDQGYNPVLARKILRENGVEPGFTMNIWAMPVQRAYNPNAMKMAELIQSFLQQVEINVNIVSYDWSIFRQRLTLGMHDSVLIGWSADNGDPDNFYRPLLSCDAIDSGTNRSNWCSQEFDRLIGEALTQTDLDARKAYYHQANLLLREQMPLVPIAHAYRYQAYRRNLHGITLNPFGGIILAGVEKAEGF